VTFSAWTGIGARAGHRRILTPASPAPFARFL